MSKSKLTGWKGGNGPLAAVVRQQSEENLRVYATSATRVDEDAGQEMNLTHGGYGKRQLLELIQNGADAMLGSPGGKIRVLLTADHLYCANEGDAIDADGIKALLHAHISRKRDAEIGRFGLGFKSVLAVSDRPEFFCREVSFGFDAEWSTEQISAVAPGRERYPALRLARLLNPVAAASEDCELTVLMEDATTVVRMPRTVGSSEWLSPDLREFDPAFMLFSPHVGELVIEDRTTGLRREIRLDRKGEEVTITEGTEARRWRVFKSEITPSAEAKREAWELSARHRLPIVWAVPIEGRLTVGRFWAFFPLRDETTLTGIANAPWQINDDRTGLLEGSQLNRELLDELSELLLRSMSDLVKPEDPGWILDIIPARGREARCWGDDVLTTRFYELAVDRPVVPDQGGRLQRVHDLHLPPADARTEALQLWAAAPGRPVDWCHASASSTTTRRSRVDRFFDGARKREESVSRWLEALVAGAEPNVDASAAALLTAASLIRSDERFSAQRRAEVQRSRIILERSGAYVQAKPTDVFIPRSESSTSTLVQLVDSGLTQRGGVLDALAAIGIEELTPAVELRTFLRLGLRTGADEEWQQLWSLVRDVGEVTDAVTILQSGSRHRPLRVRTLSGRFAPLGDCLLSGAIVPADGSRDADVAIDSDFHRGELEVLRAVGAAETAMDGFPAARDSVVDAYRQVCIAQYLDELPPGGMTPAWDKLVFDRDTHVGPLDPLLRLSDEGRAAFVEELMKSTTDWRPWTLKHSSKREYPPRQFPPPATWAVAEHGRLVTSRGVVPLGDAWGPAFERWGAVVPVARLAPDALEHIHVANHVEDLSEDQWLAAFDYLSEITDDALLGEFYGFSCASGSPVPAEVRCRVGSTHELHPPASVAVTANRDGFNALRELGQPSLLVASDEDAAKLIDAWGLAAAAAHVRQETQWIEAGPPTPLGDVFPTLREDLEAAGMARIEFVPCEEIFETVTTEGGTQTKQKDFARVGHRVLWQAELGVADALRRLRPSLPFSVDDEEIEALAEGRWQQERREKLAAVRDEGTLEERLIAAVGEERLRVRLPVGLVDAVAEIHGELSAVDIARLTMIVHGDDALHQLRDELRAVGLNPPDRWAGSRDARTFVRDLGFPEEFAGAPSARRDPELVVLGPPDLPDLHGYQKQIVAEIEKLLDPAAKDPRGMVSLPTGAGKTRVAVQALVGAFACGRLRSPVLWIAQSDELCEQAVQTWSEVWRALGTMDELRIGRLWGGSNEVSEAIGACQVVVTTIDKLRHRTDRSDYAWLAEASCVVIDEAHGAIAPEYTAVLRWLGISAAGVTMRTRVPLIGLTATPFRGTSKEETARLVKRFGARRLDKVFDDGDDYAAMYRALQRMRVLSEVDGEELETGTNIDVAGDLSADEQTTFDQRRDLPSRVFDRIAKDVDRNRLLLDSIKSRSADWPILLFAVSTEHAHTMAALLSLEGISAAAIDHRTAPALRRRYVDRFRRGHLRVLANYNVLTQGFDAPAVRAIYVARPTFSPNNYQQMIGRGLRGELNGGKARCLIVNVRDNWTMYGDRLAFYEFEHLWKQDLGS